MFKNTSNLNVSNYFYMGKTVPYKNNLESNVHSHVIPLLHIDVCLCLIIFIVILMGNRILQNISQIHFANYHLYSID